MIYSSPTMSPIILFYIFEGYWLTDHTIFIIGVRRDQICGVEIPDTVDPIRFAGRPDKYNVYT